MKKKKILMIIVLIIPIFTLLVYGSWVILSKTIFAPTYNPNSNSVLFNAYNGENVATYDGSTHGPTSNNPTIQDSNINFKYRIAGRKSAYVNGLPTNAGTYDILVQDKTRTYIDDVVRYTINKATSASLIGTISVLPFYEGDEIIVENESSLTVTGVNGEKLKGNFSLVTENVAFGSHTSDTKNISLEFKFTLTDSTQKNNYDLSNYIVNANAQIKAIAYVNPTSKTYYGNLSYALNEISNTTLYVIPSLKNNDGTLHQIIVNESITITKGMTLCLPFEGETYKVDLNKVSTSSLSSIYCNTNFADSEVEKFLKTNLLIKGKSPLEITTLTIEGTLLIGGILGVGVSSNSYQRPSGHTVNNYTQITLGSFSSIVNKGEIECRGYLKPFNEESLNTCGLINEAGSIVTLPFVLYDYRGGSYSAACKFESVFPFSIFDMPNSHINATYNYGSTLKVLIHASADSKVYAPEPCILLSSSGGLFNMSSGNVSFRYKPSTFNKTTNDATTSTTTNNSNKLLVSIDGTITLDSMTISLADQSLDTSEFYLPFSYKFDIIAKQGSNLNIVNKVKFLSGSKLTIDEGANVLITKSVVFYQSYDGHNTLADVYPNSLGSAKLINNGTLNINAEFGGKIDSEVANATIYTKSAFSSSTISREVLTGTNLGANRTIFDITTYGYCTFYNSTSNLTTDAQLVQSKTYTSTLVNDSYYWIGDMGSTTVTEVHGEPQEKSCLIEGTLITLADGNKKKVEDITSNDILLVFNHETGRYDFARVIFNDSEMYQLFTIINLKFSNGKIIKVISEHGFFDLDLMKYVYITENNYKDYVGHRFYSAEWDGTTYKENEVILEDAYITTEMTRCYSPVTEYHLNYFVEDLLSMPGGIEGLFNIFDYDSTLKYDEEKMNSDIEKYGLFTYEDFKDLVPYEIYCLFPTKYFKVAIAKNLLTMEQIQYYIDRYLPLMEERK